MTGQQIKYVRMLLGKAGLADQKEEIVLQVSEGRTKHLRDLTQEEAKILIGMLNSEDKAVKDRMVNKLISMAHEMGWTKEPGKINMEQVNGWAIKYGPVKKKPDHMTIKELAATVTAFEKVYLKFLKGV
ncbi:MAG: hypothetical protein ACXIUD_09705 [Mongoliitalea sp.]